MKFIAGKTYCMRSIGDHNCIWDITIIKRTKKTLAAKVQGEIKTFKIHNNCNGEFAFPLGNYSMCPILRANNELKEKL